MVSNGPFVELDDMRNEAGQVFQRAGYIRLSGADYLALSNARRFPHRTFLERERTIKMVCNIL